MGHRQVRELERALPHSTWTFHYRFSSIFMGHQLRCNTRETRYMMAASITAFLPTPAGRNGGHRVYIYLPPLWNSVGLRATMGRNHVLQPPLASSSGSTLLDGTLLRSYSLSLLPEYLLLTAPFDDRAPRPKVNNGQNK